MKPEYKTTFVRNQDGTNMMVAGRIGNDTSALTLINGAMFFWRNNVIAPGFVTIVRY
jgi:hypothetical protein